MTASKEGYGYPFLRSNEYYVGFAEALKGLGGVGIAVGSDQPLDFFTMANLRRVYAVDINPQIQFITKGYMVLGSRFHKRFNHYPTTKDYISLFKPESKDLMLDLLRPTGTDHTFSHQEAEQLQQMYDNHGIQGYLAAKNLTYRESSWIGSDENLARAIRAYDEGRIIIRTGNVAGPIISDIGQELRMQGEDVSLIYVSNAEVQSASTLSTFRTLPLAQHAKVLYSTDSGNHPGAIVPFPYHYAKDWSYYLFSLGDPHLNFPTDLSSNTYYLTRQIGNGTYSIDLPQVSALKRGHPNLRRPQL